MSRLGDLGARLYRGDVSLDIVGARKIWYGVSILITILAFGALLVRGLHMGVEFEGGAVYTTPATDVSVEEVREVAEETSGSLALVQTLGNDGTMRVQVSGLDTETSNETRAALAETLGIPTEELNAELIGPSWGKQIADRAWQGLAIFMVLVVIYLALAFEWRMALAALIALIHDLTITVGVYALVGFEVTPGTVIGLLTILGYSLYDTVVVFDGLKETTRNFERQTRFTYRELANRSLNGTLVRSINTSVVALLPVGGLLFIGGGLMGGGMLNDIALSIFVGLAAGAYSSIMIATPLVADFKSREREIAAQDRRVLNKRAKRAESGEEPEPAEDATAPRAAESTPAEAADEDDPEDGGRDEAAGVGAGGQRRGPRRQPVSRGRGRGRPSGKRR
ncbi:protein translocase subunit SecF [Streptomyces sp. 3MP-14]|uniref:Protein-export membrane protein SecF n=1 Tax=Streptomyces mimosae TaxID=2586635 RepID=A0A5N6A4G5_9ACTN|nr:MULTISPECIES: protein translocase subunit SecF [Streptomyces]KAB8162590.1 protein translocase subunit SecF [Streptomyces mimosae]KAB8174417.1 protein translocase subunit SecF [Streptomyces sp. 3MP-14]